MQLCVVLLLLLPVVSGFLFGIFNFNKKCNPPFPGTDDQFFKKLWQGFFKCRYEPSENPNLKIADFVRYFYIESGQTTFKEVLVWEMPEMINPNNLNYIIIHGFNDGVRVGGNF